MLSVRILSRTSSSFPACVCHVLFLRVCAGGEAEAPHLLPGEHRDPLPLDNTPQEQRGRHCSDLVGNLLPRYLPCWSRDHMPLPFFPPAESDRKILLFYLINDVLQNSRRKSISVFFEVFRSRLKQATISVKLATPLATPILESSAGGRKSRRRSRGLSIYGGRDTCTRMSTSTSWTTY